MTYHLRNYKREPKAGRVVIARCGLRMTYLGTAILAYNYQCCQKCLDLESKDKNNDGFNPLYIMPEDGEIVDDVNFVTAGEVMTR